MNIQLKGKELSSFNAQDIYNYLDIVYKGKIKGVALSKIHEQQRYMIFRRCWMKANGIKDERRVEQAPLFNMYD